MNVFGSKNNSQRQSKSELSFKEKLTLIFCERKFWIQISVVAAVVVVSAILETVGIGLMFPYAQLLIEPSKLSEFSWAVFISNTFGLKNYKTFMIALSIFLLAFFIVKNLFLSFVFYLQFRFSYDQKRILSKKLFTHYLRMPYVFHLKRNTSVLITNVVSVVDNIVDNGLVVMISFVSELCVVIAITVLLLIVKPGIVLVGALFVGLPAIVFYWYFRHKSTYWGEKEQKYTALVMQWLHQGFGAVKQIIVSGKESFFINALDENRNLQIKYQRMHAASKRFPLYFIETVVVSGALVLIIIILNRGVGLVNILPLAGVFTLAIFRLIPSISRLIGDLNALKYGTAAINTVVKEISDFNKEAEFQASLGLGSEIHFLKDIVLEKVSYTYENKDEPALERINLSIQRGQSVAFVGASGAGKTTLVDVLLGLLKPSEGRVLVDGVDIFQNMRFWQKKIGYVPQDIYLLDDTIRRNIALGIPDDRIDERRIHEALKSAKLEEVISGLKDGLDTAIGERGVRLSGGQRQRIGIARALYQDPEVLILDEATSAIDNQSETEIATAIKSLAGRKTLIIIAHRMTLAKGCDVLYFLKSGRVVSSGTYDALIKTCKDFNLMLSLENLKS